MSEKERAALADASKLAREKQQKTDVNTKFQEVQRKWVSGHTASPPRSPIHMTDLDEIYRTSIPSGSTTVRSLTSKFGNAKDNRANEDDEELRSLVSEQRKEIENLKAQVVSKEKRIAQLEAALKAASLDLNGAAVNGSGGGGASSETEMTTTRRTANGVTTTTVTELITTSLREKKDSTSSSASASGMESS